MSEMNYSLKTEEYSAVNALLWGNFVGHARAAQVAKAEGNWKGRIIHDLIAVAEFLPVISQIASLIELAVVKGFEVYSKRGLQAPLKEKTIKVFGGVPIKNDKNKDVKVLFSLETIQKDLLLSVLRPMIGLHSLVALSKVSKAMRDKIQPFINQMWIQRRAGITMGSKRWKSVGFSEVTNVPPFPEDIDKTLKSDSSYFEGKRVFETRKLVLIPAGLSVNKQGHQMHSLMSNNKTVFGEVPSCIIKDFGDNSVEESYWTLITNDVIPSSKNRSFVEQKKLLKEGDEVPSILDVIVLIAMDKIFPSAKKESVLPQGSIIFTACKEEYNVNKSQVIGHMQVNVAERANVIVGQFFPEIGIPIGISGQDRKYTGILASRKL